MTDPILVPIDLIEGLSRPQHKRLQVAAWVLSWPKMSTRATFHEARTLWAKNRLEQSGSHSVLSILLELETIGVCRVLDEDGKFISVQRVGKEGAA